MTDASVEAFCGGVDGGVSHEEGLAFARFTGELWKQPSTHFRKLFTGESSTFGSPLFTHWTALSAWNRITGFVVLFCKFSAVTFGALLGCSELSTVFNWMFSFLSSLSLASVKQIKIRRSFFRPIRALEAFHLKAPLMSLREVLHSTNHYSKVEIILNCFRCFRTISNAKLYKITPQKKQQLWYKH